MGERGESRLWRDPGGAISGDGEREQVVKVAEVHSPVETGESGVNGRVGDARRSSTISSWVDEGSWLQVGGGERLTNCSTKAQASGVDGSVGSGGFG